MRKAHKHPQAERFEVFDAADALASAVPWAFAEISPDDLARKAPVASLSV